MTTTKTTKRASTLTRYKERAIASYNNYCQSNNERLQHFYEMGKVLIDIKAGVGHGDWLPWLKGSEIHVKTAQRAMMVAKNDKLSFLIKAGSIHIALAAIRERDKPKPKPKPVIKEEVDNPPKTYIDVSGDAPMARCIARVENWSSKTGDLPRVGVFQVVALYVDGEWSYRVEPQ